LLALAALAEVSLVKHDPFEDGTPAVTVHRLVQAVARARSAAKGLAPSAVRRLIGRLVAIYPKENHGDWPLCAHLTPHWLALRDARRDDELLDRAGNYFYQRGGHPKLRSFCAMRWRYENNRLAASIPARRPVSTILPPCSMIWAMGGSAAAPGARPDDTGKNAGPRASRHDEKPPQPHLHAQGSR
jgi:hypothetical protein